ncbi:MAG: peptidoglycan-associated lipoprotein [Gammaproteobacteria bacterium]|jgi:peptidoglycan-associated lipoprotein
MNSFNVRRKLLFLCVTSLFITACQTGSDEIIENSTTMDGVDQSQLEPFDGSTNGVDSSLTALEDGSDGSAIALGDEAESPQAMLDKADSALSNRVIYFQFDNSSVSEDSLKSLEAHGSFIADNSNVSVRLEGHSDERGSREYNIALGDRRAQSVRQILLFQGASVDQLETVSYGEEQPAMLGHTDDAWSKNRRVELVYQVN